MRDRGQGAVLMMGLVALCAIVLVVAAAVGDRLLDQQRAVTAADAAALAGVQHGRTAAASAAAVNGGRLVEYAQHDAPGGRTVTVMVVVDDQRASARATDAVVSVSSNG